MQLIEIASNYTFAIIAINGNCSMYRSSLYAINYTLYWGFITCRLPLNPGNYSTLFIAGSCSPNEGNSSSSHRPLMTSRVEENPIMTTSSHPSQDQSSSCSSLDQATTIWDSPHSRWTFTTSWKCNRFALFLCTPFFCPK